MRSWRSTKADSAKLSSSAGARSTQHSTASTINLSMRSSGRVGRGPFVLQGRGLRLEEEDERRIVPRQRTVSFFASPEICGRSSPTATINATASSTAARTPARTMPARPWTSPGDRRDHGHVMIALSGCRSLYILETLGSNGTTNVELYLLVTIWWLSTDPAPDLLPTEPFEAPQIRPCHVEFPRRGRSRSMRRKIGSSWRSFPRRTSTGPAWRLASWHWRPRAWTITAPESTRPPSGTVGPTVSSRRIESSRTLEASGSRRSGSSTLTRAASGESEHAHHRQPPTLQLHSQRGGPLTPRFDPPSTRWSPRPILTAEHRAPICSRRPRTGGSSASTSSHSTYPKAGSPCSLPARSPLFANGPPHGVWSDNLLVLAQPSQAPTWASWPGGFPTTPPGGPDLRRPVVQG